MAATLSQAHIMHSNVQLAAYAAANSCIGRSILISRLVPCAGKLGGCAQESLPEQLQDHGVGQQQFVPGLQPRNVHVEQQQLLQLASKREQQVSTTAQEIGHTGSSAKHSTRNELHQQRQRRRVQKVTDADVREALGQCNSWRKLAVYLLQELTQHVNVGRQQQQQFSHRQEHTSAQASIMVSSGLLGSKTNRQKQLLWQVLDGYQARLVIQHAGRLAANTQAAVTAAAATVRNSDCKSSSSSSTAAAAFATASAAARPPGSLQQPLLLLLRRAVLRAAAAPGNAVVAAELLRAVWRLQHLQWQQQQHWQQQQLELCQQLLGIMCAAHTALPTAEAVAPGGAQPSPAASATVPQRVYISNANLLADTAQSVMALKLQPSDSWLLWFRATSRQLMQSKEQQHQQQRQQVQQQWHMQPETRQQDGAHVIPATVSRPSSYFMVSSLCLASYIDSIHRHQQQQQQRLFPDDLWLDAWSSAAAAMPYPFSSKQLSLVLTACKQLQLQLPNSFWHVHLSAVTVAGMPSQQLLQLLTQLASLLQHNQQQCNSKLQQQRMSLPLDWQAAAAEALPAAAVAVAAAVGPPDCAVLQVLPQAVIAAYQLRLPLQHHAVHQLLTVLLQHQHGAVSTGSSTSPSSLQSKGSSSSILGQSAPAVAGAAVFALAEMSTPQPPSAIMLTQLQQQLLPHLANSSMQMLVDLLWVFAVKWRVQPTEAWLAGLLTATEPLLARGSAKQLRMLIVGLAVLQVVLPADWVQAYLRATAMIMGVSSNVGSSDHASSSSRVSVGRGQLLTHMVPGQQQLGESAGELASVAGGRSCKLPSAAFTANVAYSLVRLGILPDAAWQEAWHACCMRHAQRMTPNQIIDTLYAAAMWAEMHSIDADRLPRAAEAVQQVAAAADASNTAAATYDISSVSASSAKPAPSLVRAAVPSYHHAGVVLQPKPERRWPQHVASGVDSSRGIASALYSQSGCVQSHQRRQQHGLPPESVVKALLQQLRQQLPHCTPAQSTTALWCLRPLHYKASVAWLDAVSDALLAQLPQCDMLQLQQLLRSLLHQRHVLAPARIDAILNAALVLLNRGDEHCSKRQLVWLLQLVVQLHHDPEPDWTEQVAAAAERMLLDRRSRQQSSSANGGSHVINSSDSQWVSSGWSPELLTELLDSLAQLGPQQLPISWGSSFRTAARRHLPQFSGLQLARLLAAIALSHWEVPRVFMQLLLLQLQQRMPCMDLHSLGLAGVAVGQMGLVLRRGWIQRCMSRVQHLVRNRSVRVPVDDAANLQRTVQYLRWCNSTVRVLQWAPCKPRLKKRQHLRLRACSSLKHHSAAGPRAAWNMTHDEGV